MSTQLPDLFDVFSETFGKEKAHRAVRDIEDFLSDRKRDLATKHDLTETELRLTKEIELTRGENKETELKLTKEIESVRLEVELVRGEIKEVELRLTKEIESVRLKVEQVRSEIQQAKSSTITWVVSWVAGLLIAYTGAIFTIIKLLKYMP